MSERVMLVVWKWREFEKEGRMITAEYLHNNGINLSNWSTDSVNGRLFDVYDVCEQRPDGGTPLLKPSCRVVRTYVNNAIGDASNPCFLFLGQLIRSLKSPDNQLFVFLHRRDGFGEEEVRAVLQDFHADKCFLIGGSRDFIYRNLLSDDGRFFSQAAEKDRPEVKVADNGKKLVFEPYFEKVWEYYQHEFYTKIFELKEDLLSHFYAIFPGAQIWNKEQMHNHLKNSEKLHLRVHSFMNDTCHCLEPHEKDALDKYGRTDKKSYEFDDCYVNLAQRKKLVKQYDDISNLLNDLFHDSREMDEKTHKDWLALIEERFAILLHALQQTI